MRILDIDERGILAEALWNYEQHLEGLLDRDVTKPSLMKRWNAALAETRKLDELLDDARVLAVIDE